jgi:hypothetical protein
MARVVGEERSDSSWPPNLTPLVLQARRSINAASRLALLLALEREYGSFVRTQFRALRAGRGAPPQILDFVAKMCHSGVSLSLDLEDGDGAREWRARHADMLRQVEGRRRGRTPSRSPDDVLKVAFARARGESWAEIARKLGTSRQASKNWRKWPEVRRAELIRPKRPSGTQRLGARDREVEAPEDPSE